MAFKKRTGFEDSEGIRGFWNREKSTFTGEYKNHVNKGDFGGFHLVLITEGEIKVTTKETIGEIKAGPGDLVAFSSSAVVDSGLNGVKKGTLVRLTSRGKIPHPKNKGQFVWDMDVEVDDGKDDSKESAGPVPF